MVPLRIKGRSATQLRRESRRRKTAGLFCGCWGHRKCSHADPEAAGYGDCARSRGRVLATSPTASAHVRANDVGLSLSLAASQPTGDQTSGPRLESQLRAGIGCGRNAPSAPPEAGAPRGALVRGGFKCARGIVNVGTWVERFNARITSRPADESTQGQKSPVTTANFGL